MAKDSRVKAAKMQRKAKAAKAKVAAAEAKLAALPATATDEEKAAAAKEASIVDHTPYGSPLQRKNCGVRFMLHVFEGPSTGYGLRVKMILRPQLKLN